VQKQYNAEGLILCGCSDISPHGKIGKKGLHFSLPHFCWMTLPVEQDKPSNPGNIALLCPDGVVLKPNFIPHLFQKLRFFQDISFLDSIEKTN
jgi:hypothetical protein